jgi:cytochrome c oxidase assembly factor CtaG
MTLKSAIRAAIFVILSTWSGLAWAHPEDARITPQNWPSQWAWEPGIVIPLAVTALWYGVGAYRIHARNPDNPAIRNWRVISFFAGWLTLIVALLSPLHKLGSVLFSAHMTQHELLMVIAAPLLAMGKPLLAFLFALPPKARSALGAWTASPDFRRGWLWLSGPLTVWILHGATLWAWHIPALYQATLDNEWIHATQHITFLGTALLFWWTLIEGRYGRFGYGAAFAYVFTTALHTSVLGALITFTGQLWYPIYAGRTAPWRLSPMEDQQLGGLIMWIPCGVVFVVVGLAMFAAWIGESERRQQYTRLAAVMSSGVEGEHGT